METKTFISNQSEKKLNENELNLKTPFMNDKSLKISNFQSLKSSKKANKAFSFSNIINGEKPDQFKHNGQFQIYEKKENFDCFNDQLEKDSSYYQESFQNKLFSQKIKYQNKNNLYLPPIHTPFSYRKNINFTNQHNNDFTPQLNSYFNLHKYPNSPYSNKNKLFLSAESPNPFKKPNIFFCDENLNYKNFKSSYDSYDTTPNYILNSQDIPLSFFEILVNKKFEMQKLITNLENDLEEDLQRIKNHKRMKQEFENDMNQLEHEMLIQKMNLNLKKKKLFIQQQTMNQSAENNSLIGKRIINFEGQSEKTQDFSEIKDKKYRYFISIKNEFAIKVDLPQPDKNDKVLRKSLSNQNIFEQLFHIFKKMLLNERVNQVELDSLTEQDKIFLKTFFLKKKIIKNQEEIVFEEETFNSLYKFKTERRKEENLKHVMMLGIKFLRYHFRKNHPSFVIHSENKFNNNKELIDFCFYSYYFGKVADKNNCKLEKFYHPKIVSKRKKNEQKSERLKSINTQYMRGIKKSKIFVNDFNSYLNNDFVDSDGNQDGFRNQTYEIIMDKLIYKFNFWDSLMRSEGPEKGFEKVIKDFTKNPKCKLPWSYLELKEAVNFVNQQLEI